MENQKGMNSKEVVWAKGGFLDLLLKVKQIIGWISLLELGKIDHNYHKFLRRDEKKKSIIYPHKSLSFL